MKTDYGVRAEKINDPIHSHSAWDNVEAYNVFVPKGLIIIIQYLCLIFHFWLVLCTDFCLWTVRIFCLSTVRILSTLLAPLVAGASWPQGSLCERVAAQTYHRFARYPTL